MAEEDRALATLLSMAHPGYDGAASAPGLVLGEPSLFLAGFALSDTEGEDSGSEVDGSELEPSAASDEHAATAQAAATMT